MNTTCSHCGEPLNATLPFCKHCGMIHANNTEYECETHADRSAIGMCMVCYKPLCEVCKTIKGMKLFCGNQAHHEILNDWSIVHHSESEFEADAIRQNLKAAEIESKSFSLHDHVTAHFIPANLVTVWVRKTEVQKATTVLTGLHLLT